MAYYAEKLSGEPLRRCYEIAPPRVKQYLQAAHGLLGDIDHESTGNGVIVCKDGFRAGFMRPADFQALWASLDLIPEIREVDGSATFCESVIA